MYALPYDQGIIIIIIYLFTLQVGFSPGGSGTTIKYTIRHKQLMTLQTINDTANN
jgi:hypothetical protein